MSENKNNMKSSENPNNREIEDFNNYDIVVVGCGGAGNNMVNKMYNEGIEGIETIAVNTDRNHLNNINSDKKIFIGSEITDGCGAKGNIDIGEKAAKKARGTLVEAFENPDLVFVIGGLGGGTGTGASPIICELSNDLGATTIGMVSIPFRSEKTRIVRSRKGISRMKKESDTVILLDNERLSDYVPQLPIGKTFSVMDQIVCDTIKGISKTVNENSIINIDYADLETLVSEGGISVMLIGDSKEYQDVNIVSETLQHPLFDTDYESASGGLIYITCGTDVSIKNINRIAQDISDELESDTNIIWGANVREDYDNEIKIMAILTGIEFEGLIENSDEDSDSENFDNYKSDVLERDDIDTIE